MIQNVTPEPADLAAAVAQVVAAFRAEDPARAHLTTTEIIDETVAELDQDDITNLVDAQDMSAEVAAAYRTVLSTHSDRLHAVIAEGADAATVTGSARDRGSAVAEAVAQVVDDDHAAHAIADAAAHAVADGVDGVDGGNLGSGFRAPAWDLPLADDDGGEVDPTTLWMQGALARDVRDTQEAFLAARAGCWDSDQVQVMWERARDQAMYDAALAVAKSWGSDAEIQAARERADAELTGRDRLEVLTDYVRDLEEQALSEGVELSRTLVANDEYLDAGAANGEEDPWDDFRHDGEDDGEGDEGDEDGGGSRGPDGPDPQPGPGDGGADAERAADAERDVVGLICPECGDDAVEQATTAQTPHMADGQFPPTYSHPDGEPLCAVSGPRGDQPADPVEVLADESAEDPLQQACAAVTAADQAAEAIAVGADSSAACGDDREAVSDEGWER
ncbi:hypothetical protein [Pseudonocardia humida]|uniref:Uncharacterized protein n=1 Tax=Pseudonocardia humida TaxID=2800819 RepID=A0ABT1A8H2_9PSEU|nr:hypothetical protein [Pseudonocardia humida]MCO1659208.1 hypothetical protein [Pseudonocardia humida]